MYVHVDQKTHRTKRKHSRIPVALCALQPLPYQSSDSISARSVRGNPKIGRVRTGQGSPRSNHTHDKHVGPVPHGLKVRQGVREGVRRSARDPPEHARPREAPPRRRAYGRDSRGTGDPPQVTKSVIESTPYIYSHVPHSPIYIQNPPKCTCICTCTYLSVDRPPNIGRGPKHRILETSDLSKFSSIRPHSKIPPLPRQHPSLSVPTPPAAGESLPRQVSPSRGR